jgi:hypothetical protein
MKMIDDKVYREWIQRRPSCISGRFSEYVNGEGRCVAAHVRRAKNSGTAFKAGFSCVPLTQEEHLTQHQRGELQCLLTHLSRRQILDLFAGRNEAEWPMLAKQWFDEQVVKYREQWERLNR